MPTRRSVLLGAGAAAAVLVSAGAGVEQGLLPGRPWLQERLGLNGEPGVIPDIEPGPVEEGRFVSEARGGVETGWALIRPPGRKRVLPVVVALHWLGADHSTLTGPTMGLDRYLAAHVAGGGTPFAIATVDGGRSYWHPHEGEDAGAMVAEELLPVLGRAGLDTDVFGLIGWSMGGYGALRLAGLFGPSRVGAVAVGSPALWSRADEASRTGFSDPDEYRRDSIYEGQQKLQGIAVRIDCGTGDPFYRDVGQYVAGFPESADVVSTFEPGAHEPGYWRRMLPAQLGFLGEYARTRG